RLPDGTELETYPLDTDILAQFQAVYESVPGWEEDISAVRTFEDQNGAFVYNALFPVIKTAKMKGKIPYFGKDAFTVRETSRAVRADSNRIAPSDFNLIDFETKEQDIESALDYLEEEESADFYKYEQRLTKDLTDYLDSYGVDVRWMHSDIDALERVDIIRGLRLGEYDVLVGVNLLREGLDLPEVSLVAILDADQQGFLRSETSLIQTAGRAARNVNGQVILYADEITEAMQKMINETERRRTRQLEYNEKHDVTPEPIKKSPDQIRQGTAIADEKRDGDRSGERHHYGSPDQLSAEVADPVVQYMSDDQKRDLIEQMEEEMEEAAENLEFERAAELRDSIEELEAQLAEGGD
ncbi:MAG: helicase-related protein, partial [Salinibacter sp.]